jgi:RsiW-degrading membrane proteinase PrsW (M82 family)
MMKLVLTLEEGAAARVSASIEFGSLEIGRGEGCQLRIPESHGEVSRRHATIRRDPDGFRIEDHSANGTWVNGRPTSAALLRSGDRVRLGSGGPSLLVRIATASSLRPAAGAPPGRLGHPAPTVPRSPREAVPPPARRSTTVSLAERGLYDPARDKGRRMGPLGVLVVLGMLGAGAVLGFLAMLMTLFELGWGAALVGVAVAFSAAPAYLAIWLWLDRYDPEPPWVLAGALVWGAGAATLLSGLFNTLFGAVVVTATQSKGLAQLLSASVSAPIVEEGFKGLAVILIFLVFRREFDGVLDGIVYAGIVALGFATVENVLYYGRSVAQGGAPGLLVVFFFRGVLGPFSHAVFTSMIGVGCGVARETHNSLLRVSMPLAGYAGAVFLHFLWNTLAAVTGGAAGFLLVYVVIWAPLFVTFFSIVVWMGIRESRLIRHMLDIEVARGLLTRDQADTVASWPRRIAWLLGALGDLGRLRARRSFLHAATRLALSYWHVHRAMAAGGQTLSFAQVPAFQRDIERLRSVV